MAEFSQKLVKVQWIFDRITGICFVQAGDVPNASCKFCRDLRTRTGRDGFAVSVKSIRLLINVSLMLLRPVVAICNSLVENGKDNDMPDALIDSDTNPDQVVLLESITAKTKGKESIPSCNCE